MTIKKFFRHKNRIGVDHRREERSSVSLEARLNLISVTNAAARVTDLSVGDCYVATVLSVASGEKIELSIRLPSGGNFAARGTITYLDAGIGFGVRFDLNEREREFLIDLIDFAKQD